MWALLVLSLVLGGTRVCESCRGEPCMGPQKGCYTCSDSLLLDTERRGSAVSSADAANGVQLTSEKQTSVVNMYSICNQLVIITIAIILTRNDRLNASKWS
jgi:hypothetical protein